MSIITLTTDFGARDWFVGVMKGVIMSIAPEATIVDIAHGGDPGNIQAGAFALAAAFCYFPRGTVHVAVIDPGVGGSRAAIAVETRDYVFVGPDNGVLSWSIEPAQVRSIRRLDNPKYVLGRLSQTFHGRDVFAPAAAHLSKGVAFAEIGSPRSDYQQLQLPVPKPVKDRWIGSVMYIDRFGNAITNLTGQLVQTAGPHAAMHLRGRKGRIPICTHYAAVGPGKPLAVVGSTGFLELAINAGSAAELLGLDIGDPVTLCPA